MDHFLDFFILNLTLEVNKRMLDYEFLIFAFLLIDLKHLVDYEIFIVVDWTVFDLESL